MWCTILEIILIYFSLFQTAKASLDDVTSDVGLAGRRDGVLAAFGDFNSDKNADLFLISNSEDYGRIHVYLWDEDEFKKDNEATVQIKNCFITNVIPGDFDGDGHLDALVAYHNLTLKDDATFVKVFLGKKSHFEIGEITLPDVFIDQPAIVDFNGDLQPDLLGEKKVDNKRYWWKYIHENKTFQSYLIPTKGLSKLSKPHSCGFLDLNGDGTPDLFIPTSKNGSLSELSFEVWFNEEGKFNASGPSLVYESDFNQAKNHVIGQSTFADIDSDGIADHLLPVCDIHHCEIRVYDGKDKWIPVLTGGRLDDDLKWKFIKGTNKNKIPFMTLRIGDYNLDGYPDAAAIIELIEEKKRIVVLFKNVDCSGSTDCFHGRKLSMVMDNVLSSIDNPVVFGFFDLYENGILDLFIVSSNDTSKIYQIHAIENTVYSDTCFLKVIVLGGSCFSNCPSGVTPYGVNQAGPYVKYVTTGPDGDTKKASATQLSQAAYFALQPPYTVFGLGRTPNFVEKLIIGLPRSENSPKRRRTWTSIIPNSQVIIIPIPPDEPDEWKSKLLVTPSRLVLLTGGALLATCVFIGAIVALLHWKEKREDRREKQEAAHKFHFDAM